MLYRLVRPALFALDAERAHGLALAALKALPAGAPPAAGPLAIEVAGLAFPNPLGMAAGFDKDGEVPDALLGPRLRLRRGRLDHPAAAGGQPEAAAVPARRGPRGDQPDGVQQRAARTRRRGG